MATWNLPPVPDPKLLNRSYFNDSALSDLTIKLSDGTTVYVHRVILCRGSRYFEKLITGGFKETDSKEIELCDDEPDAVMAMLRFIYDLPYIGEEAYWHDGETMLPYAQVYTVAEKYEQESLKQMAYSKLDTLLHKEVFNLDLIPTIREIITGTPESDCMARKLFINACVDRLPILSANKDFMALLKDLGELGAAIITEHIKMFERGGCNNPTHLPRKGRKEAHSEGTTFSGW